MQHSEHPFTTINQILSSIDKKIDDLKKSQMEITGEKDSTRLMTITEASKFLNLSKSAIYSKTSKRMIPFVKKGKRLYFVKSDLLNWLNKGKREAQESAMETSIEKLLRPLKK